MKAATGSCSVKKKVLRCVFAWENEVFCSFHEKQVNQCSQHGDVANMGIWHFFLWWFLEVSFLHILYEFHEIKLNVMKYELNCVSWNSPKVIFQCILAFKKRLQYKCLFVKFTKFLRTPVFYRKATVAASKV